MGRGSAAYIAETLAKMKQSDTGDLSTPRNHTHVIENGNSASAKMMDTLHVFKKEVDSFRQHK